MEDRAFGATRDEDRVHRVPRQAVEGKVSMTRPALALNEEDMTYNSVFVPTQNVPLLHGANIGDSLCLVVRYACVQVPMRTPCERLDRDLC